MKSINKKVFGLDLLRRRKYETKGDLIKYHAEQLKELNKDSMGPDTLLQDLYNTYILYEHLYEGRRMELDMASHIEELNFHEKLIREEYPIPVNDDKNSVNGLSLEDSLISFNFYQNKYLVIDTPIVFKNADRYCNDKDLLTLAASINAHRKQYENLNNISLSGLISAPYWVVMVRKMGKDNYRNFADSDNIELKKVSNVITEFLGLSDSPVVKRDCTISELVAYKDDIGLSIVVMEDKYYVDFISKFSKNNNINFVRE